MRHEYGDNVVSGVLQPVRASAIDELDEAETVKADDVLLVGRPASTDRGAVVGAKSLAIHQRAEQWLEERGVKADVATYQQYIEAVVAVEREAA